MSGRRTGWALATLTAASCAVALGACGGDDDSSDRAEGASGSSTATQKQDSAITQSQSSDNRGEDGKAGSVNQSQSSSSSSSSSSQSSSGGTGLKTFSGTGRQILSFNVDERSRLVWTDRAGHRFTVSDGSGAISIDSRSGRGEIKLGPGDYDGVNVRGDSWTIVVRPD